MMQVKLGKAYRDEFGALHGRINGIGIGSTDFLTEHATAQNGRQYFKLIADPLGHPYDIGAAFRKQKDGLSYYSVSLESPLLQAPIHAALFPDPHNEDSYNLV